MKKNTGFTLVEIVVVVALIAILLVFIVSNLNKNRSIARDNIRIANIDTIRLALDEYRSFCGVYPDALDISTNNGRNPAVPCQKTLGNFIGEIPKNPTYSSSNNRYYQDHRIEPHLYMYFGMSHTLGGPCFDYIIGIPLEYGSRNEYAGNEHAKDFEKIDQSSLAPDLTHRYSRACNGSTGNGITDADNAIYGIYGFRSADAS